MCIKINLALSNQKRLICHKFKLKLNQSNMQPLLWTAFQNVTLTLSYNYLSRSITSVYYNELFTSSLANGPGHRGSFPGRVIPKTLKKWYLIPLCLTLSIIRYVSKVKWGNPGKGKAPSPTPWYSSFWKWSLQVTLDYGCQLITSF